MNNEKYIFSAVQIHIHPDAVVVFCGEGSEVETCLDGISGDSTFLPRIDPVQEAEQRVVTVQPSTATVSGPYHILLPVRGVQSFHFNVAQDEKKFAKRQDDKLVWFMHDCGQIPWTMVQCMIVHNIIDRLAITGMPSLIIRKHPNML